MSERIRLAVVGGNFGEVHIAGFKRRPEIEVVAICRRNKDLAHQLAQRYEIDRIYTDFGDLVRCDDIDVVSLAVPNYLHYPMTMKALDYGKHVICEKPLALNLGEATEMTNKAKEKGLINMIVFNWRFVPAIIRMKELIERNEIDRINHIVFSWLSRGRRNKDAELRSFWRFSRREAGFGVLGDTGVHGIDLIQWIFGDFKKVISHMAICIPNEKKYDSQYKNPEVEDSCSFLGELANGISNSR